MTKSILIIDDSRAIRDMVAFALKPSGYQIFCAENGALGLDKLREEKPDLVITDLNMPVMNGLDFIRNARKDTAGAGIPIVLLTTETRAEMKAEGKAAGATGWINKPFNADMLISVVKKLAG